MFAESNFDCSGSLTNFDVDRDYDSYDGVERLYGDGNGYKRGYGGYGSGDRYSYDSRHIHVGINGGDDLSARTVRDFNNYRDGHRRIYWRSCADVLGSGVDCN
jgi:hypothetical protein